MIYALGGFVVYVLHLLLRLNGEMTLILGMFVMFMLPFHQRIQTKAKENEQRFFEVSLYLDTLLYAFVKEEKIDLAIKDVGMTLPEGRMQTVVKKAYMQMSMVFQEIEMVETALYSIEKEYPCKRIKDAHQFMTHVEYYGGEIAKPIALLLEDKGRWEQRIRKNMKERKKQFTDVVLSILASLGICGAMVHLPIGELQISQEPVVQTCALLVVVLDECILLAAQHYLNVDWIGLKLGEEDGVFVRKMEQFQNYNRKQEERLSFWLGGLGVMLVVLAFLLKKEWLAALFMGLTLFFFQQHKIGRALARKNLVKEIEYAFPNWLLDLVLLLQSENVHMALEKSKAHVPGVLRKELYVLTEHLQMEPESASPYHAFLKEFAIPEVHSAMGILYSISIGDSSNADKQIGELIERNLELLDVAEIERLRVSASGLYMLFLLPVVVASFKLVVDMFFMMIQFIYLPGL